MLFLESKENDKIIRKNNNIQLVKHKQNACSMEYLVYFFPNIISLIYQCVLFLLKNQFTVELNTATFWSLFFVQFLSCMIFKVQSHYVSIHADAFPFALQKLHGKRSSKNGGYSTEDRKLLAKSAEPNAVGPTNNRRKTGDIKMGERILYFFMY